jgi:GTPase SAR1 family protein
MISRINFFGGPGVGKSTLAAKFFTHLKQRGHNIELVQEYVKQYVYTHRNLSNWGHVYTFGRQLGEELRPLEAGVRQIVTDSPLMLQVAYARYHGCPSFEQLAEISLEFETDYQSLNFLVLRTVPFDSVGRWQDEEGGKIWDKLIEQELDMREIPYHYINPLDSKGVDKFLKFVETLV